MKVSYKLLLIGLIIILSIALSVHFFGEYQTELIKGAYEKIKIDLEISVKILEAHIAIDNFHIDDISTDEYYEKGNSDNLTKYKKVMNELKEFELKLKERSQDNKDIDKVSILLANIDNSFQLLIKEYTVLGYNDYGLEAEFSNVRDSMEAYLDEYGTLEAFIFFEELRVQEMKLIQRKKIKYLNKIHDGIDELKALTGNNPDFAAYCDNYLKVAQDFYDQFIKIGVTSNDGLRLELNNNLEEMANYLDSLSQESYEMMQQASINKTVFGLLFIIIGIIVSSLIFFFFSRNITQPLSSISLMAKSISGGDLTFRLDSKLLMRKDELGVLSKGLNDTMENLRQAVHEIKSSADKNEQVGEKLNTSADLTSQSAGFVQTNMGSFTTLFTRLDKNIARVNEASNKIIRRTSNLGESIMGQVTAVEETGAVTKQMSNSLNLIAKISKDKRELTNNLIEITNEGGERVQETNMIIKEMAESTDKIKELIKLINEVSAKTNLLSMNAAIEAAHAGELGLGFSIVAEEIQKLSETTTENVKGMTTYLNSIIKGLQKAMQASEKSGTAFIKVSESVSDTTDAFNQITNMVSETSSGSNEMLKAIQEINSVAQDIDSGSKDILDELSIMGGEMKEIAELSAKGFEEIQKTNNSVNEIYKNTNTVAQLSSLNEKVIEQLKVLVLKFNLGMDNEQQ